MATYRLPPPQAQGDAENAQMWIDFTAPTGKELRYRTVSINAMDNDAGAASRRTRSR